MLGMGSLSCRHPTNLPPFLHVNIPPWQCPCGPEEISLCLLWVQPLATIPSMASHVRGGDVLHATCCRDGIPLPCALPSPSASTTHILPFRAAVLGPDLGLLDGSQVGASHSQQRPTTRDRDSGLGEAAMTLGLRFWERNTHPQQPNVHLLQPACTALPPGTCYPPPGTCYPTQMPPWPAGSGIYQHQINSVDPGDKQRWKTCSIALISPPVSLCRSLNAASSKETQASPIGKCH